MRPLATHSGQVTAQRLALASLLPSGGTKVLPHTWHVRGTLASAVAMAAFSSHHARAASRLSRSCHSGASRELSRAIILCGTATRLSGERFAGSPSARSTSYPSGTGPWTASQASTCFARQLSFVPGTSGLSATLTRT